MALSYQIDSEDYTVGWICAVQCEIDAAKRALDREHDSRPKLAEDDKNSYIYGEIPGHNVVITCLPQYGTTPAAATAIRMQASFRNLRHNFLVGVAGSAPSGTNDIRLGDIVSGILNKPSEALLRAIPCLRADHHRDTRLASTLSSILTNGNPIPQLGYDQDRLFTPDYLHPESCETCDDCDPVSLVKRKERTSRCPQVHYGLIASGNQVMKDATKRDELASSRNVLCFEMEAAGLMDSFSCLVVRGICDYSDSHKNKDWQPYAAASAAAYAKTLLKFVTPSSKGSLDKQRQISLELDRTLRKLFVTDSKEDRRSLMARRGGPSKDTCQWIFETDELDRWLNAKPKDDPDYSDQDSILWFKGTPGSGKSTTTMYLTERLEKEFDENRKQDSFAYFFCEANHDRQNNATSILRGLLWQIVRQNPILQDWLPRRFSERDNANTESFNFLWTIFSEVARDGRCGVLYCIIDALDECDSHSQRQILEQLKLSFFDRPSKEFTSKVRILITSRPYPEIEIYLGLFPSGDLSMFVQQRKRDIDIFTEEKVTYIAQRKAYPADLRDKVKEILESKADNTFLWIGLTCDELINVDPQDTLDFLEKLAPGLNALYAKMMEKAIQDGQKREKIYSILSVVAVSRQPLSLLQLCNACSLYIGENADSMESFIRADIKRCRLMVVESEGLVNLLHKSVIDFLFKSDLASFPTIEETHAQVAYLCIDYTAKHFSEPDLLLEDQFERLNRKKDDFDGLVKQINEKIEKWSDFIPYSAEYWMEHAQLAGTAFHATKVTETHFITIESLSRDRWLQYHRFTNDMSDGMGILHIAAEWGITSLIDFALNHRSTNSNKAEFFIDTDFIASDQSTPLQLAARWGSRAVFTELISRSPPPPP